jgi:hypothetical protein
MSPDAALIVWALTASITSKHLGSPMLAGNIAASQKPNAARCASNIFWKN